MSSSPLNVPEFSVSEFSSSIKRVVEDAFGYVRIRGEVSGFKKAASGHLYFTLKDEKANLSAVCFRSNAAKIDFEIADGLEVTTSGRVTTYEGRSNYQIIIEKIEIAGIGAILEMIEKRRQKLFKEGLFEEIHKKEIPFFPKKIGIITSPTGAVIEDIKHRVSDRCPSHVMIFPSLVQGPKAAQNIIQGIEYFNNLEPSQRPQTLIIARGGGSFEDLIPFCDEELVRSAFKSQIPIISAVGHETDITLLDYVADLRAPTPSAAAEFATPILADLYDQVSFFSERLKILPKEFLAIRIENLQKLQKFIISPKQALQRSEENIVNLKKKLDFMLQNSLNFKSEKIANIEISSDNILQKINFSQERIGFLFKELKNKTISDLESSISKLKNLSKNLKSHHYDEILKRGFFILESDNQILSSSKELKIDSNITIKAHDGTAKAKIIK